MTNTDARGTLFGLLATIGYMCWMVWLLQFLVSVGAIAGLMFSAWPYGIACGLGFCQLMLALWGNGRFLKPVRSDRRLEFPPDAASCGAEVGP